MISVSFFSQVSQYSSWPSITFKVNIKTSLNCCFSTKKKKKQLEREHHRAWQISPSLFVVVQSLSRVWLRIPMDCSTPGFPVHPHLPQFAQIMSTESVMPSNHLILRLLLLLLPSFFPSIRVFSSESTLRIRWPKYENFSCSISPSNEYSELISF